MTGPAPTSPRLDKPKRSPLAEARPRRRRCRWRLSEGFREFSACKYLPVNGLRRVYCDLRAGCSSHAGKATKRPRLSRLPQPNSRTASTIWVNREDATARSIWAGPAGPRRKAGAATADRLRPSWRAWRPTGGACVLSQSSPGLHSSETPWGLGAHMPGIRSIDAGPPFSRLQKAGQSVD